jgi:hypothetical protein
MGEPVIHYITVATKPHIILDLIKNRIAKQYETITILGEKENRYIGWQGTGNFGIKLKEVQDYLLLENLDENDIILFTDAYDVIYCSNFNEIIARYLKFEKPIIFGCEKFCNPDPKQEPHYKYKSTEFPYLNSGLFIGRVWALRKCMEKYKYNDKHDDQLFWTLQFFHSGLIELDYSNSLFLNTGGIDIQKIIWNGEHGTYNGAKPLFIHVNGPDKSDLRYFLAGT